MTFDLRGSKISEDAFQDYLQLVQSYVLSPGYCPQSFFTESTLCAVRSAIDSAGVFFVTPGYDIWKDARDSAVDSFVAQCKTSYDAYLLDAYFVGKSYEQHYVNCIRMNRLSRVSAVVPAADTGSTTSSGSKGSRGHVQTSGSGGKLSSSSSMTFGAITGSKKGRKNPRGLMTRMSSIELSEDWNI